MGIFDKLKSAALGTISARIFKMAGDGTFGPTVAKIWWKLDGHKTEIGVVLSFIMVTLEGAQKVGVCDVFNLPCESSYLQLTSFVGWLVATGFLYAGQVGGALYQAPPMKPPEVVAAEIKAEAAVPPPTTVAEAVAVVEKQVAEDKAKGT